MVSALAAEQVSVSVMAIRSMRIVPQKASDNSCTAMGAKLTSFPRDVGSQLSLQGS